MDRAEAQEWLAAIKADAAKANSIFSKEWEESKHPRGAGGKFGSGSGSLATAANDLKNKRAQGYLEHSEMVTDHKKLAQAHMAEANKLARNAGSLVQFGNAELGHITLERANDHERASIAHEEAATAHSAQTANAETETARAAEASAKADRPALGS
jgi:hypothetical protein